jgi:hypothetical protein
MREIGTYDEPDQLVFETVRHDGGANYDRTTGTYTCPSKGIYMFL